MRRLLIRLLIGVIVIVVLFAGFVLVRSELALRTVWKVEEPELAIPNDAQALTRGEHIAITRGCTACHEKDLAGSVVMDVPMIGRMACPNLTSGKGSVTTGFGPRDWERAIRHGVKPDGRALLFMPVRDYAGLSDADTADLIAYVRQQPAVDREETPSYVGPFGRTLFALGQLPMLEARLIDHRATHVVHIEMSASADYGNYLAQSCTGCHGEHFSGGPIPGTPPDFPKPANITPDAASGIGSWSKDDFYRVFREGKKPNGSAIDPFMPWQALGKFSDTELDALWAFLRSVPARQAGQR
jgi:cytochrome c553